MADTERRYTEDEIASIFSNAAQRPPAQLRPAGGTGLTLSELQQIGGEVGLSPDAVADAAARLNSPAVTQRQPAVITRKHFWLPVEAGRAVELPRRLTDLEWTQLVADLQTTFEAQGKVEQTTTRREWRGGETTAVLIPTDTGERLLLSSFRRRGIVMFYTAMASFNIAAITFFIAAAEISTNVNVLRISTFAAIAGAGILAATTRKMRAWSRLARQQVDGVVTRLLGLF